VSFAAFLQESMDRKHKSVEKYIHSIGWHQNGNNLKFENNRDSQQFHRTAFKNTQLNNFDWLNRFDDHDTLNKISFG
jgi:hypothetical protein